jgi:hypothetical protein
MPVFSFEGQLPHSSSIMSFSEWVLDSDASHHMPPNFSILTYVRSSSSILVITADDTSMSLAGVDSVVISHLSLSNVYFILKLRLNLALFVSYVILVII